MRQRKMARALALCGAGALLAFGPSACGGSKSSAACRSVAQDLAKLYRSAENADTATAPDHLAEIGERAEEIQARAKRANCSDASISAELRKVDPELAKKFGA